jgi:acetoin utilization deacetylase AcuC-like enzyme
MAGEIIDQYRQVFVLDRPPGHHASRNKAGGFCFFNNMAALALSMSKRGYTPLIIDWDVHHGNGTQELLYDSPIMYTSFHQKYLYPNTGSEDETGEGQGKGYTRNFPLPIGMQDKEYLEVFNQVRGIAEDVKPDILLISAGQDAHYLDRLSGLRLSSEAYHQMGCIAGEIARQHCDGRVILVMEGGYHLEANAESLAFAIKGIRASDSDN